MLIGDGESTNGVSPGFLFVASGFQGRIEAGMESRKMSLLKLW